MVADPLSSAELVVLAMIWGKGNDFHLRAVPMDGRLCEARLRRLSDEFVAECMPMGWWIEEQKKPRCRGALCRQP